MSFVHLQIQQIHASSFQCPIHDVAHAQQRACLWRRDISVNWDEGGMPWTCLAGEPSNVNWCNGAGGADLYKNPPEAWRGANTRGELADVHLNILQFLLRHLSGMLAVLDTCWCAQVFHTTPSRFWCWATSPTLAASQST